jgi:hypothetical protein
MPEEPVVPAIADTGVADAPTDNQPADGEDPGSGAPELPTEGPGDIGDQPEDTEGAGEGDGEHPKEGEEDDSGEYERDGRKIDAKTRQALADFKKINPAAAKILAETHYRENAYKQEFPTVQAARQAKATIESLGGEDGITNLQGEVEDYRNEIKQFSEGDPALLQQLNEANPEAFVTSIGNGLEMIASTGNSAALDKALMPVMVARLEKAGMFGSMTQLAELIKEGKGQEAYDLTLTMSKWLGDAKAFAKKNVDLKSERNPEREALDRERADVQRQKTEMYEGSIATDVNRLNNSVMSKAVEPLFKDLKLKPDGRREFVNALQQRVWKAMKEDAPFQRAAKAIKAKGDVARTSRFVHSKFAELLPQEFRNLRNAMYPSYKTNGARPSGNGAAPKPAVVPKPAAAAVNTVEGARPTRDEVDWSKTDELNMITGKGVVLKNGKVRNFNPRA